MKKLTGISLFIFFCVVSSILTAGLVFYQNKNNTNTNQVSNNVSTTTGTSILDSQTVLKHNTISDCWMIINNKVYDLSNYATVHPGGTRNVTDYCGKEATVAFDTKGSNRPHSTYANNLLDQYYVGDFNQQIDQKIIDQNLQKIKSIPLPIRYDNEDDD
ncbi:MAG: cytochrome b5 domain-containing protein [Minisyncoccia bacterium]